jgi:hypothetical protein
MARIRTIKPEFASSEQIVECSTNARLLFALMWCFCDDNGIHPSSMKRLKMEVFPADDFSAEDIRAMVEELLKVGLLMEYETQGEQYLIVTGWNKHQKIDRPNAKYPLPPLQKSTNEQRAIDEDSTNDRRAITPGREGKGIGVEGKGVEKEKNSSKKEKDSQAGSETKNQDSNPLFDQYPDYRPDVLKAGYRWFNWYRQKWVAELSDVDIREDLQFLDGYEDPMAVVELSIRYKSKRLIDPKYPVGGNASKKPEDPPSKDPNDRCVSLEEARKLAV